ncbi:hypothetical protein LWI28_012373 [Acer negundo]|uniref:Uncharacterized protein n=1 Tax=Acer negundo TaxID=4023 RepID=A0AAD5J4L4_ACENE|nr:hypothetical protein LWI28_012373 [Acer negundo]
MATPPNTLGSSEQPPLSKLQISNKTSLTQYGSIKFDRANYLLWETMIMPVIKGHKLDNYVLGTKLCPPEFLPGTTPGSTVKISNPDYEEWISHDQLLLGWLYSTMNPDIASQLMKKSTSKELRGAAKELSGAHTKSRVIYYKGEYQKTRKVGMKIDEYLNTIKAFFDNLALAGSPISLPDLITQILSGLDVEYTPIVVQLSDKESLSWIELQTTLLTFESRLEQLNTCQNGGINLSQTTAHIAINRPKNRSSNFSYGKGQNRPPNNNNSRGFRGRFRGIKGRSNGNKPTCQLCNKIGHTASICWNIFDQNFMGSALDQFNQSKNQSPNAFIASPEMLEDPSWYADTGASHHVTNDLRNLHQKQDYIGKNSLVAGNGSKLDISHIGEYECGGIYSLNSRNLLLDNKNMQIARFQGGLKHEIQDQMKMLNAFTLERAFDLARKAEERTKPPLTLVSFTNQQFQAGPCKATMPNEPTTEASVVGNLPLLFLF